MDWFANLEADQQLVIVAWPVAIVITAIAIRGLPVLYRLILGYTARKQIKTQKNEPNDPAPVVCVQALPDPSTAAMSQIQLATERIRSRSHKRLALELSVVTLATLITVYGWLADESFYNNLQMGMFLGWVAGTWSLRSVFFARRPRISEPLWGPTSFLLGLAVAIGMAGSIVEGNVAFGFAGFGVILALAVAVLYLILGMQQLLRRLRASADTATHIMHWGTAIIFYCLIWTLVSDERVVAPEIAVIWLLGMPLLYPLSKKPMLGFRPMVFLRNFALGRKSSDLLKQIANQWLEFGPIDLLTGPDVAASKPDPATVWAMLTLRLQKSFVTEDVSIEKTLNALTITDLFDGRHRVRELACGASNWQAAVRILLQQPSAVTVMDLRSFDKYNIGCVRELELLAATNLETQPIIVIDEQTDINLIEQLLDTGNESSRQSLTMYLAKQNDLDTSQAVIGLALDRTDGDPNI